MHAGERHQHLRVIDIVVVSVNDVGAIGGADLPRGANGEDHGVDWPERFVRVAKRQVFAGLDQFGL